MPYGLPDSAINKLRQVFQQDDRIANVLLYGSRALGKEKPASDIDLCIVADNLNLRDVYVLESKIDDLNLPWKVDLSLKHHIDNPALQKHIESFGVSFLKSDVDG